MGLEYFKNQTHIKDLQKLNYEKLFFIIRLFKDELTYFNNFDGFKLQGLITACKEAKDLLKDLRFILCDYMDVIEKNDYLFVVKKI